MRHGRRAVKTVAARLAATATATTGAALLAHYLPSATILATWLPTPPTALPSGWCRWRGPADRRAVALTFDDGPSPDSTPRTLDLLDELGMKATFFVIGELATAHPDLVAEMRRRGHAVGSHGQRHEHHLLRTPQWVHQDVARSVASVAAATGERPRWYRPSYGQMTASTIAAARRCGMDVVLWTRWGKEFADTDTASVLARLETGMVPGAILLLHDTDELCPAGTAARTHRVLEPLAAALDRRGLVSVTLDELLAPGAAPP